MNDPAVNARLVPDKGPVSDNADRSDKVNVSIAIDADLFQQINRLTNDPSKVIEVAVRQWLGGNRREDEQSRPLYRNPPVPPKGEWND